MISKLEQELFNQIKLMHKANKMPMPITEFKFFPSRKWRADFCWIAQKLIVEVEGGLYGKGRHTSVNGFIGDCEKYNNAELLGFHVLRVASPHIKSGQAIKWIEEYLNAEAAVTASNVPSTLKVDE